jgi:hypothetical protein
MTCFTMSHGSWVRISTKNLSENFLVTFFYFILIIFHCVPPKKVHRSLKDPPVSKTRITLIKLHQTFNYRRKTQTKLHQQKISSKMRKFLGIQQFFAKQTQCSAISKNNYFKNYTKVSFHLTNF